MVTVKDADNITLIAEYQYNPLNHRVLKKTYTNGTLTETRTFYYNQNWQCLNEYVGTVPTNRYYWGLRYIDDLVARKRSTGDNVFNETTYSLADPNWNVVAFVYYAGNVLERMYYNAFGKPTIYNGALAVQRNVSNYAWTRTFTGQVYDPDTGLMLYRNRYYHPTLGRFVTRDPIGYEGDDENLYRYVKNTPIGEIDKEGLQESGNDSQDIQLFRIPRYRTYWFDKPTTVEPTVDEHGIGFRWRIFPEVDPILDPTVTPDNNCPIEPYRSEPIWDFKITGQPRIGIPGYEHYRSLYERLGIPQETTPGVNIEVHINF